MGPVSILQILWVNNLDFKNKIRKVCLKRNFDSTLIQPLC